MKMRRFIIIPLVVAAMIFAFGAESYGGLQDRSSYIELQPNPTNRIRIPEISAPSGDPASGWLWVYVKDNAGVSNLYVEYDDGTVLSLGASATITLDAAYTNGSTIDLDASGDLELDLTVTARKIQIANTYAGTQAIALEIDAEAAQAITDGLLFACTAGTIVDAIDAKHASITNAINVGANVIYGTGGASIDFDEFDVSGTTGAIIINDGGDLGSITIEGTVLDINSLDFVAAGAITAAASSAITIDPHSGDAAGEDLIVTAHNVQLTAGGALTFSPDGAVTTAITVSDTDYTNWASVGTNNLVGTTGTIDYTNFDVNADGDVDCEDLTVNGTANIGTWAQDNIVPASASPQAITLNAGTTGKIQIGSVSTGNVELAGAGTTVDVLAGADLVISEGDFAVTSTSNEDVITVVNNTSTDKSALLITQSATTTGKVISVTADAVTSGSLVYLDTTLAGFTGYYIQAYDGVADDFSVKVDGVTVIAGTASTDSFTLTTGDVQIGAGDIDVDAGMVTVDAAVNTDRSYYKNSADIGAVGASTAMFTLGSTIAGGNTTNAMHILALEFAADGDAEDGYLVLRDNSQANTKFAITAGGATAWTLDDVVIDIDADATTQTTSTGVINMNVKSATASNAAIYIDYELDDGGSGIQNGVRIVLDDDSAGGDETFRAFSAAISAGSTATSVGLNISADYDKALEVAVGAASIALDIDAATVDHTGATGVVDIEFDSITADSEAINIKATALAGGSGQSVAGMEIELDNDTDHANDVLYGLIINVTDSTATGKEKGIYIKGAGIDAGIQMDTGYLRIGTGSTPGVTPGDDDLYVEGTVEVDGDTTLDGKLTMAKEVMFKHGGDIASPGGAELDLTDGTYFDITGTNNITSIAAADSVDGRFLILRFEAILTFTDGNNLKLAGNLVTTADDTITLICDGTDWWELARSAN